MLPITQWFESVNSIDDIISERRPLAIIPVLIFIVSIGHLFQVLVVQFVFVVIGEIRTKPNESAEVSRNAAVSPTKLFSTRSVDALASAQQERSGSIRRRDFADAFFLLGRPFDFFRFGIGVGGDCESVVIVVR